MVRPGRKRYRMRAQKNGGKTRQEQLREKLRRKNERLREQELTRVRFNTKPLKLYAERCGLKPRNLPMFGVFKTDNQWQLVGYSAKDYREVPASDHRGGSELKTLGYYYLQPNERTARKGMPITTASTKKAIVDEKLRADSTNRIEPGTYVVRLRHNPKTSISDELDQEQFRAFQRRATRLRD